MTAERFCFIKQKTAYELRISDWSSDVCSSDLMAPGWRNPVDQGLRQRIDHFRPGEDPCEDTRGKHQQNHGHGVARMSENPFFLNIQQIGRASCRERVSQYV